MPPPRRRWDELTTAELAAGDVGSWVGVLPIAATEQHGPHLPLGTDTMIGEGLLARLAAEAPADLPLVVLPTLPYGKSDEHRAFPGTLTLSADVLTKLLVEIGASAARAGLRRLVILSSHGGNSEAMAVAAQALRLHHAMLVVATNWMRLGQPEGLFSDEELRFGIHAGEVETSLMLDLRPDLVRRDRLDTFPSRRRETAARTEFLGRSGTSPAWAIEDLNPVGAVGDAAAADAGKGARSAGNAVAAMLRLLNEVAACDLPQGPAR